MGDILLVSWRIGVADDKVGDLVVKLCDEEVAALKRKGDISEAWHAGGAGEGEGSGPAFSDSVEEGEGEEEVNVRGLSFLLATPCLRTLTPRETPNHCPTPLPRQMEDL